MSETASIRVQNTDERLAEIISDFFDDRVGFAKHILHFNPTEQQAQALAGLDRQDHIAVKSGHGCGKSGVESACVLHYMSCRPFPKIPCTAPSKHQLFDVLWAEISKWHRQMNPLFRNQFVWTKEKIFHKDHPEEWFAVARTATKENPEALQGFHADYVLRVIDEASGVPEAIFEVADGAYGRIETKELMCGNPTRLEGTFFHAFGKNRTSYLPLTWSCLKSSISPREFIERARKKYGEHTNYWNVRVLGEFPKRDDDTFIPYDLVYDALYRDIPSQDGMPKTFGVDVARFGDDATAIAIRQGDGFKPYHILRNKSTMETAGFIAYLANREKPKSIFVDVIGIGAGVFDRLQELGYPVIPVNVSESPAYQPQLYKRLRDELWGNMRAWLEMRRGHLSDNDDQDLLAELTTPKFHLTSNGLIVMESKDDMKKRGLPSPNIADAHIMTFAQPMSEYTKAEDDFFDDMRAHEGEFVPLDMEAGY